IAKNVRRFLPQAYVTCLLGRGRDKVHILDRKDFAGGVVEDIEHSLRFIERNTRLEYKIEKLKREEIPEYPMAALREAITNAVMHRDYFQAGANVFVEVYSDRIEVTNPGGLPNGLAPADLGTVSVRRNLLVADLLHRIGYIEKAGTGIRRMREDAERHGCPEPQFKGTGFFTAVFRPRPRPEQLNGDGEKAAQVGTKSGPSRDQVRLLDFARSPRALLELMELAGRSNRTKFREQVVHPLLETGWLEMTIPDKPRSSKQRYRTTAAGVRALSEDQK
nr:transcriptional regulator [bacterium]